jgi:uncharacterized protein YicC (UPF0701 family)
MKAQLIPIGSLLVLREDLERIEKNERNTAAARFVARQAACAIEELIERREKEGAANA